MPRPPFASCCWYPLAPSGGHYCSATQLSQNPPTPFLARALVPQAHGSKSSERPRPGVYQECLEKAEADQEETVVSGVMGLTRVLQC